MSADNNTEVFIFFILVLFFYCCLLLCFTKVMFCDTLKKKYFYMFINNLKRIEHVHFYHQWCFLDLYLILEKRDLSLSTNPSSPRKTLILCHQKYVDRYTDRFLGRVYLLHKISVLCVFNHASEF